MDDAISCTYTRDDGFGTRQLIEDATLGRIEVLDLTPALATRAAERAIRTRLEKLDGIASPVIAPVHRVVRDGEVLYVVSSAVDGVPLCELLAALEFGTLTLPSDAVLELAAMTVQAVAAMHENLESLAHGALNPAHVMLTRTGGVVLTDHMFGDALQQLERNRWDLWRTFSLAMPAAAAIARFDRRNDVTQLGGVVLAILLRRTLLAHEYPRSAADLVMAASVENGATAAGAPRLRSWLQQALQLQPRGIFPSAIEAAHVFADVLNSVSPERQGAGILNAAVRGMLGESVVEPQPEPRPLPTPIVVPVVTSAAPPPAAPEPQPRPFSFLRSVLPNLRSN